MFSGTIPLTPERRAMPSLPKDGELMHAPTPIHQVPRLLALSAVAE